MPLSPLKPPPTPFDWSPAPTPFDWTPAPGFQFKTFRKVKPKTVYEYPPNTQWEKLTLLELLQRVDLKMPKCMVETVKDYLEDFTVEDLTDDTIHSILMQVHLDRKTAAAIKLTFKKIVQHLLDHIPGIDTLVVRLKNLDVLKTRCSKYQSPYFSDEELHDCCIKIFSGITKCHLQSQWGIHTLASVDEVIKANISEISETHWTSCLGIKYKLRPAMWGIIKRMSQKGLDEGFLFYNASKADEPKRALSVQRCRYNKHARDLHPAFNLDRLRAYSTGRDWDSYLASMVPPAKGVFKETDKIADVLTRIASDQIPPEYCLSGESASKTMESFIKHFFLDKPLTELNSDLVREFCMQINEMTSKKYAYELIRRFKNVIYALQVDYKYPLSLHSKIEPLDYVFKASHESCALFMTLVFDPMRGLVETEVLTSQQLDMLQFQLISGKSENFIVNMVWKFYTEDFVSTRLPDDSIGETLDLRPLPALKEILERQTPYPETDLIFPKLIDSYKGVQPLDFKHIVGSITRLYPMILFNVERTDMESYLKTNMLRL